MFWVFIRAFMSSTTQRLQVAKVSHHSHEQSQANSSLSSALSTTGTARDGAVSRLGKKVRFAIPDENTITRNPKSLDNNTITIGSKSKFEQLCAANHTISPTFMEHFKASKREDLYGKDIQESAVFIWFAEQRGEHSPNFDKFKISYRVVYHAIDRLYSSFRDEHPNAFRKWKIKNGVLVGDELVQKNGASMCSWQKTVATVTVIALAVMCLYKFS